MAQLALARYQNLSAILSVAALLVIIAFAGQLSRDYIARAQLQATAPVKGYTRPPVQGYKRPAQAKKPKARFNELATPQQPIAALSAEQNAIVIKRFEQAAALLHAKQYEYAISALDEVLRIVPNMPEAYVNIGYAFFGLKKMDQAEGAFKKAIDLRPYQANAYYGLASVLDAKKDYEAALGAMRTFIHLSQPDNRFLAKARSAIWEWEGLLGRIPGVGAAPAGTKPQIDQYVGGAHEPPKQEAAK
jgi:tetratricopeptide (TPR) repeat protein